MNNEDNPERERELRERIASAMRASDKLPKKAIPADELMKLKSAASRLDQMLKSAEDADRNTLKSAAARLEQMLANLRAGKPLTPDKKRRKDGRESEE